MSYEASAIVYFKFLIIPASRGCRREVVVLGKNTRISLSKWVNERGIVNKQQNISSFPAHPSVEFAKHIFSCHP